MIPTEWGAVVPNTECHSWCLLHFTVKGFVSPQQPLKFQRRSEKNSNSASLNLHGSVLFLPPPGDRLKLWPPGCSDPETPYPEAYSEANGLNWRQSTDGLTPSFFYCFWLEQPRDNSDAVKHSHPHSHPLTMAIFLGRNIFLLTTFKALGFPRAAAGLPEEHC